MVVLGGASSVAVVSYTCVRTYEYVLLVEAVVRTLRVRSMCVVEWNLQLLGIYILALCRLEDRRWQLLELRQLLNI